MLRYFLFCDQFAIYRRRKKFENIDWVGWHGKQNKELQMQWISTFFVVDTKRVKV